MTGFMLLGKGETTRLVLVVRIRDCGCYREAVVCDIDACGNATSPAYTVSPRELRPMDRTNEGI